MHLGRGHRGVVLGTDAAFAALGQQVECLVQSLGQDAILLWVHLGSECFHVEGGTGRAVMSSGGVLVVHSDSPVRHEARVQVCCGSLASAVSGGWGSLMR